MKIAIITGASSGLGAQFAKTIIQKYDTLDEIWLIARRKERLKELERMDIKQRVRSLNLDLSLQSDLEKIQSQLEINKAIVSILINNAGIDQAGKFESMDWSSIDSIVSLNIRALTWMQHVCMPYMNENSFSILTCSVTAFYPVPNQAVYSASKHYIYALARALHEEQKGKRGSILCLCPGNMDTEMNPKEKGGIHGRIAWLPYLDVERVVCTALRKAEKKKRMYTPGWFYVGYRWLCKWVPDLWMRPIVSFFQ